MPIRFKKAIIRNSQQQANLFKTYYIHDLAMKQLTYSICYAIYSIVACSTFLIGTHFLAILNHTEEKELYMLGRFNELVQRLLY